MCDTKELIQFRMCTHMCRGRTLLRMEWRKTKPLQSHIILTSYRKTSDLVTNEYQFSPMLTRFVTSNKFCQSQLDVNFPTRISECTYPLQSPHLPFLRYFLNSEMGYFVTLCPFLFLNCNL